MLLEFYHNTACPIFYKILLFSQRNVLFISFTRFHIFYNLTCVYPLHVYYELQINHAVMEYVFLYFPMSHSVRFPFAIKKCWLVMVNIHYMCAKFARWQILIFRKTEK